MIYDLLIFLILKFNLIFLLSSCASKKTTATTEKKPTEPVKVEEKEVKSTPSPLKPTESPAKENPNPEKQKQTSSKETPKAKEKSVKDEKKDESKSSQESIDDCPCHNMEASKCKATKGKKWAGKIIDKSCATIIKEYQENFSVSNNSQPCKAFDANPELNRFKDIKCLDKTRVVIRNGKCDYINASMIDIPESKVKYILTQGPMTETCANFWQMCYENDVKYIVMISSFVEGGVEQCCQYFPEVEGEKKKYGNFEVEFTRKRKHSQKSVSHNILTIEDQSKNNSKKQMDHVMIPWWTCEGTEDDLKNAANIIFWLLYKGESTSKGSPIVVHCASGIGRSATFVAISILKNYILKNLDATMVSFIKLLREQRFGAIETEQQYMFVYACFLEYFVDLTKHWHDSVTKDDVNQFFKDYKVYVEKKMKEKKDEEKKMSKKSLKEKSKKDKSKSKSKEKDAEKVAKSEEKKEEEGKDKE